MSTAPAKKNRTLLYLLLGAIVLKLGWEVLQKIYVAISYLGLNTVLALDLSAYGKLTGGGWPSFALLGLGLGAASGAIAAQRRFALARPVGVGGWVAIGLLLVLLYATVDGEARPETLLTPVPTQKVIETEIPNRPPAVSEQVTIPTAPPADTSSIAAEGQQQVIAPQLPLQAKWTDSLASPLCYLPEGDTVLLHRQAPNWTLVTSTITGMAGWVRRAGLRPFEPKAETESATEEVAPPPLVVRVARPTRRPPATNVAPDTAVAVATVSYPSGHQQHSGQIGELAVTYALDWQASGEVSGNYFYNQQPGKVFRLTGTALPTGELRLLEFTKGRQSARGVLRRQGNRYVGQLLTPDGQQQPITLE